MKKKDIMTTSEFAKTTGTPYQTVVWWAQHGVIPGAEREETLRGPVWVIPRAALDTFENWKPKIGRPRKAAGEKGAKRKR
jgi:hypothetical protein